MSSIDDYKEYAEQETNRCLLQIRKLDATIYERIQKVRPNITLEEAQKVLSNLGEKKGKPAKLSSLTSEAKEATINSVIKGLYAAQTVKGDEPCEIVMLSHVIPTTPEIIKLQRALLIYSVGYDEEVATTIRGLIMTISKASISRDTRDDSLSIGKLEPSRVIDSLVEQDESNYIYNELVKVIKEILSECL